MTVEPFTFAMVVANVANVSSRPETPQEPMLLARGRATASALSGRRNLDARAKQGTVGRELCRQAAEEQDPKRLLELTLEINRLLLEKEDRLIQQRTPKDGKESA